MSSWVDQLNMVSTKRREQELAHWKSKVMALEYENKILVTTLKQMFIDGSIPENVTIPNAINLSVGSTSDTDEEESDQENSNHPAENDDHFQACPELIDFLSKNSESKKMREERNEQRRLEEELSVKWRESCPVDPNNRNADYEELYGPDWQTIAALEMSMQCQFIADCDKYMPPYWPTLPLKL